MDFLQNTIASFVSLVPVTLAQSLILAFVVEDLEGELESIRAEGVDVTMPLTEEEWGERAFQVRDPNGVIVQLVDWNGSPGSAGG